MKKLFISAAFVLSGSLLWWALSNTAQFSIKKWDAKIDSVLRHSLTEVGVKNEDLLSSVNELKNDTNGSYVVRRLSLKRLEPAQMTDLVRDLEKAGAQVDLSQRKEKTTLMIRRGSRTYQEISFN